MTKEQINCEQALKQILDYVDRELGEHERAAMQAHLHTCKSCFSRMEFERRLKEKVGAVCDEEVPAQLAARVKGLLKNF
ncbi:MAG TPA: zf-HC2 domain-containing protein [Burkholderiales bacterium]|jgi:mycothiol system anti-sigma-R factor|nr:zf-HC2 domain-containing protein [Burkholderiales bacterium]